MSQASSWMGGWIISLALVYPAPLLSQQPPPKTVPGESQVDAWTKLRAVDGLQPGSVSFALLDRYPLVTVGQDLSEEATALSTVLSYEILQNMAVFMNSNYSTLDQMQYSDYLQRARSRVEKGSPEWLESVFIFAKPLFQPIGRTFRRKAVKKQSEQNLQHWRTPAVTNAAYIQSYLKDHAWSIPYALRHFARDHGLSVQVEMAGTPPSWPEVLDLIGRKMPLLIEMNGTYQVIVGWYKDGSGQSLMLYDPSTAKFDVQTGEWNLSADDRNSTVPWIQNANRWLMKQVYYKDHTLNLKGSHPPGLRFMPLESIKSAKAIRIRIESKKA